MWDCISAISLKSKLPRRDGGFIVHHGMSMWHPWTFLQVLCTEGRTREEVSPRPQCREGPRQRGVHPRTGQGTKELAAALTSCRVLLRGWQGSLRPITIDRVRYGSKAVLLSAMLDILGISTCWFQPADFSHCFPDGSEIACPLWALGLCVLARGFLTLLFFQ